jgi:very-short-patch-repair endonuclease
MARPVAITVTEQRKGRPERSARGADARLAAFVADRDGIVTTAELRELGLSDGAICHRARSGRLHRLHTGVYAVGHPAIRERGRWRAAVAACGDRALLSHRAGARLWELPVPPGPGVEVTVPGSGRRRRPGIRIHRSASLGAADRAEVDGIPVTSVARTLLDLAGVLDPHELERAVIAAERKGLLHVTAVLAQCGSGHSGSTALREVVRRELAPEVGTESELERLFIALCRRYSIALPVTNTTLAGLRVDCYWADAGLVVELDGHAFHRTPGDQRRDAARDRKLTLEGIRILRFGWTDVTKHAYDCAETVTAALTAPSGRPHR